MITILESGWTFLTLGVVGMAGHICMLVDYKKTYDRHKIYDDFLTLYSIGCVIVSGIFIACGFNMVAH